MSTTDNRQIKTDARSGLGPDRDRLDSWKEIAVYLRREVRTVQRWEKNEGLPIHRHIHLKGGTVYAMKEEINVWLTGRGQTPGESGSMKRHSRLAVKGLNPPQHVVRQMLSAFGLWLAVVAKDSYQDSDDLALPDARMTARDSHSLTGRPQSQRNPRARQVVTHRESRALSFAVRPGSNYSPGNIGDSYATTIKGVNRYEKALALGSRIRIDRRTRS